MSRVKDLMIGAVLGAASTAAIVAFAAEQSMDPVKLSPQYYTMRVDNPRVRVYEYRLPPGAEGRHAQPSAGCGVFAVRRHPQESRSPTAPPTSILRCPGDVAWRDDVTHAIENIGATEAYAYALELKGCTG